MRTSAKAFIAGTTAAVTVVSGAGPAPGPDFALASHDIPFHWDRFVPTATAVAQMYAEDHSSSAWPVNASVVEWNKSDDIGMYYRTPGNCNYKTLNCFPVYSGNYGDTDWYGQVTFTVNGANHIDRGSMTMYLNDYYKTTASQRRSIACHELGHTTGVFDDSLTSTTSCMTTDSNFPLYPNSHDFDVLADIYDH